MKKHMFLEIDDPEHRAILTAALDDYCRAIGIGDEDSDRLRAARLVLKTFNNGAHTPERLSAALAVHVHFLAKPRQRRSTRRPARRNL
jgi:hypothetical protein